MGHISHLSPLVVNRLQSGAVLSDLARIVEELVCNSIDAKASEVRVYLEVGASYLKVEDNGSGISRNDLALVGEWHATSKLQQLTELEAGVQTLGFRGEALSALSDVSLVEITSRVRGSPNTYKKIMKSSKTISIGLARQQQGPGTTVIVRDIFYTLPVRRKLLFCKSSKVLQSVKDHILRLALIHPEIAFSVHDIERKEELLHTRRAQSVLDTISDIFGKDLAKGLQQIDFAKGNFRLSGYISTSYYHIPTKALQYFYINRRFVHKTRIDKLLRSFDTLHMGERDTIVQENPQWSLTASRGTFFPAYVLNLGCRFSEYDISFESTKAYVEFKDWPSVLSFVEEVLCTIWGAPATLHRKDVQEDVDLRLSTHLPPKRKCWQHSDPTYHPSGQHNSPIKDADIGRKSDNKHNLVRQTTEEKLASERTFPSYPLSQAGRATQSNELQPYQHQVPSHCGLTRKSSQNDEYEEYIEPFTQVDDGQITYPFRERGGPYNCTLSPESLSRENLQHARILGQVDKKFIAVCCRDIIIMIDQHAADERVRLEELRKDVLSAGKKQTISLLNRSEEILIAFGEEHLLQSYREQIEDWGWRYKIIHEKSAVSDKKKTLKTLESYKILLSAVPCIQGVNLTASDLFEYLHQFADTNGSSAPPPAVLRVLNFKACRSAIMFGDVLLPGECRQLVEALKQTSMCFQCAHGRPTMVPVMDLNGLQECHSVSSVNATSGTTHKSLGTSSSKWRVSATKKEKWHGLQWQLPTLERSIARLKRAQAM
ncbi:hypothetical protein O6H91_08G103600 [Diphasiastrum complanatum]|uniref:Uncharacterized protein n=3 Tax=Diphasiastrum complanatum TaxID=34168 RepID=A0ACC2D0I0_DIPCM|nr:hypothetical protein O6H91_08G103600 [Diphasiastrum complanatum]